jgi:predicted Rossmann fold flavoprotein
LEEVGRVKQKTVLVIGGGAAGLTAAICASRQGAKVTVLEKLDRVGKKILATGNGRCNIMNVGPQRFHGGEVFAKEVLVHADVRRVSAFFESLGLTLREEEEGRVYPASGLASSVLDVLRLGCARNGVEVVCGAPVSRIDKRYGSWLAYAVDKQYAADAIIVAGGGKAAPKLGSDGSVYALLTSQGHRLISPRPAITQLKTETEPIRGLTGIRAQAEVWLTRKDAILNREKGEILFTEYGVRGVAAMQLARDSAGTVLHISLLPAINIEETDLFPALLRRAELFFDAPLEQFFSGWLHARLGMALFKRAGIGPLSRPCSSLTSNDFSAIAALIVDFPLAVLGVQGFDSAQVTAGGIDTSDFDPATMASRLAPGLYAAGEVLDVDGDCGGFNLLFAWACGILAGEHAAGALPLDPAKGILSL